MRRPDRPIRVLDIGAKRYRDHPTYKEFMPAEGVEYVGLDLEAGTNVDVVPASPYVWAELETESFDACVSGQTFEHNPAFWITFAEMVRVLRPGGLAVVIAPGRGAVHRYPFDCWRFYPDSWPALCHFVGIEIVETLFEDYAFDRTGEGASWCDSTVVARKPELKEQERAAFYARLEAIASTAPANVELKNPGPGRALNAYLEQTRRRPIWRILRSRASPRHLMQRIFQFY